MKNYREFLSSKDETWRQAIDRYLRFIDADMKGYFDKDYSYRFADNPSYIYHRTEKVSHAVISAFTDNTKVNVPPDLSDLLCIHGAFNVGDGLFEIFGRQDQLFMTLNQVLERFGHSDFIDKIGIGMQKSLNGFYFFFGVSFPNSDETGFLFFSKSGYFGKMLYSSINPDIMLKKVLPSMFNGSIEKFTLDSLISSQMDRVIINALTVRGYID
ncbi:MAG: hypothetical protein ACK5MK_08480 [Dysgonomonas sp.]